MNRKWDTGIGVFGVLLAMVLLFAWIPTDIRGEFIGLTSGGRPTPGDAFYPVLLAGFVALVSLVQLVLALRGRAGPDTDEPRLTAANLAFLLGLAGIVLLAYLLCYHAGPALAEWLSPAAGYRQLIDTAPYKYLGFLLGGFALTAGSIVYTERRLRWRTVLVALALLALLLVVFDVALTNIQLPPNAEA